MKIQKILDDNFKGLEDAMDGDKDLAHFYKSLIGVCIQEYALDVLDSIAVGESLDNMNNLIEKEEWQ